MKKHHLFLSFCIMLLGAIPFVLLEFGVHFKTSRAQEPLMLSIVQPIETPPLLEQTHDKENAVLTIGWVGDIAPDTIASPSDFSKVRWHLQQPDLMLGNLEGVITDGTIPESEHRCIPNNSWCWIFRGDENFLHTLTDVGFDAFNIANNHMRDHGKVGEAQTRAFLEKNTIPFGADNELRFARVKDTTVGLIGAYLHGKRDYSSYAELVRESQEKADLTIVMMHGGEEGAQAYRTINADEYHKGGYRGNMYAFAHEMVDAGADLVLGSGPHVVRGIEMYQGKLIAYSLGNFYGEEFSTHGILSSAGILHVTLNKEGLLESANLIPLHIDEQGLPSVDHEGKSIGLISEFGSDDFKENAVLFDELGIKD